MRVMKRTVRTWLLETSDNRTVFTDEDGDYTLDPARSKFTAEFREGEHPDDDKDIWAKTVSDLLGVECHCVQGADWTEDQLYG
jgi:hypothetical protein